MVAIGVGAPMRQPNDHLQNVRRHYDNMPPGNPYVTLAPGDMGGRKSQYVSAVFDAAVLPLIRTPRRKRILDFGCGPGALLRQMSQSADEVIGVDISTGMLERAASLCDGLNNVKLLHTDGCHLGLPDEYVDLVTAREVLCYLPDDELSVALAELHRATRTGGEFIWVEQVSNDPHWQKHPEAPHCFKRNPRSIVDFATAAGWMVESQRVIRTPRFPWIYPIWLGLFPSSTIPYFARKEVAIHSYSLKCPRRWWNALFRLRKPVQ
jgi:SAM-dependent methyltransferase